MLKMEVIFKDKRVRLHVFFMCILYIRVPHYRLFEIMYINDIFNKRFAENRHLFQTGPSY